jgi:hypothetical protein
MVNQKDKLEVMLRERSDLRQEIILLTKGQVQVVKAFVTVLIFVAGVYWGETLIPDQKARSHILFFLTQMEVFFIFYMIALFSNIGVHSRYIAELERQINNLCGGEKISRWESEVSLACLFHPRGGFLWAMIAMTTMALALFVFILIVTFHEINSLLHGMILALEVGAFLGLLVYVALEPRRIEQYIRKTSGKD